MQTNKFESAVSLPFVDNYEGLDIQTLT